MDNTNEPAYPMPPVHSADLGMMLSHGNLGLTKREAFAMAAMQAMANDNNLSFEIVAGYAVQYADALLAELAKEKS